ncbi:hypothetical protein HNV10_03875 [Winogradskyella litoriviva]|uniref:Uncharacterized protein n=1 Tax=Winogradskyella litoriviva TaxID=1220182 RepID=A0ABX2E229_9FLAO|nr:hypothetical protein [Winogradskyella litoriviva]NRD22365.1 hypothetical protein [Winogradskyella litoriviva]
MQFEPQYFSGILKVLILTLLMCLFPIYFIENKVLIFLIFIVGFSAILFLKNKKWINRIKIDSKNSKINIEYPLNLLGQKNETINFSEISKVVYYEYISRTPAHFKVELNDKTFRFNCNRSESELVNKIFKDYGIETNFYHKKEVGFR